ncbi:hypothetical protein FB45DRAFT_887041 [Roridomyces roridus]|uniref:Protein-lysine N-methyltransferase EFM4 n=1 Tax=Roridomyces roridus TaxID=1738132 RepID=A0AAD7CIY4_9AGAR|nr:hypothetical protein FB45DRAFT_887041 [Roridomyces roridus]
MSVDLQPSKLGTKDHWDQVYKTELENFQENGDEGEIWFGLESVRKMVKWAKEHVPPTLEPRNPRSRHRERLRYSLNWLTDDAGYDGARICGIDYSPDAVNLAHPPHLPDMPSETNVWDLILDKGTFDAIALGEKQDGKSPAARYPGRVTQLLKPGGSFLITSCNFTEEELKSFFATPETGLIYHSSIQHRSFTFGGKTGSSCSSVAFRKPPPPRIYM